MCLFKSNGGQVLLQALCVLVVKSCVELLRSCGLNNLVVFRLP